MPQRSSVTNRDQVIRMTMDGMARVVMFRYIA